MSDGIFSVTDVVGPVSRETSDRLTAFVELVRKWQPAENLVAASTLPEIWRRHVADSAQLLAVFPDARRWLDLGSGAGFPGIVLAILLGHKGSGEVHLVESNQRKCAFLRAAIREADAPAVVHAGRIETVLANWREPVDRLTARALAPLDQLLELASPLLVSGVPAAFPKGQEYPAEIDAARWRWDFDFTKHESKTGEGSVILDIRNLKRRGESG